MAPAPYCAPRTRGVKCPSLNGRTDLSMAYRLVLDRRRRRARHQHGTTAPDSLESAIRRCSWGSLGLVVRGSHINELPPIVLSVAGFGVAQVLAERI